MTFLCVDIGGTNTLLGLGNGGFEVEKKIPSTEFLGNVEETVADVVSGSPHSMGDLEDVAIAAAGPVDHERGVFYPPNLFKDIGLDEVPLREPLEKFGDVEIVNDCTSAVIGEYCYGNSRDNMLYLTISSGIGAGVILDGNVVEGHEGNLGEVGHMRVSDEDFDCGCGGKGHWEGFCSGNNLPRMARELYDTHYSDAREIFEARGNGDRTAKKVIERMNRYNTKAVADLIHVFNPELITMGGAVALNHPETILEPLRDSVSDQVINGVPEIELCQLEEKAVIHGLRAICNGEFNSW